MNEWIKHKTRPPYIGAKTILIKLRFEERTKLLLTKPGVRSN